MELSNKEKQLIQKAIELWKQEGKISPEQANSLKESFKIRETESKLAKYFFIIALSCTLFAFGAIFIDEKLLEKIKHYFSLNNLIIALLMAGIAAGWFWLIVKKSSGLRSFSYEVYMILGGLASVTSLVYVCKDVGFGKSHTFFLFLSFIIWISEAVLFRSKALWLAALLSLTGWFGAFTEAHSHTDKEVFLGMNYPVRFTIFGALMLGLSRVQSQIRKTSDFQRITYLTGLIIFFLGLWGVSIFGNYHNWEAWMEVRQTHVIGFGILFGVFALLAMLWGIKQDDDITRDLGILFLLINFYSRYFEYFWDSMHKGIFFLILAVSFWLIGKWIEKRRRTD